MTFILYFILLIKGIFIILLAFIPGFLIKLIIIITIIIYINKQRSKPLKTISLKDLKIINPVKAFIAITFCTLGIISTLFIFRLLNVGRSIDLKLVYQNILIVLSITNSIDLIINILLILCICLLTLQLLKQLKDFIFYQFIKIYFYLMRFDNNTLFFDFILKIDHPLSSIINFVLKKIFKEDSHIRSRLYKIVYFIETYLHIILIITCIIYDILFNNFILSKIYYVFPIAYLYILYRLFITFSINKAFWLDNMLSTYLYGEIQDESYNNELPEGIRYAEEGILYTNGTFISVERLIDLELYAGKGFCMDYHVESIRDVYIIKSFMKEEYG